MSSSYSDNSPQRESHNHANSNTSSHSTPKSKHGGGDDDYGTMTKNRYIFAGPKTSTTTSSATPTTSNAHKINHHWRSKQKKKQRTSTLTQLLWNREWDAVQERLQLPPPDNTTTTKMNKEARRFGKLPCFSNAGQGLPLHLACAMRPLPPFEVFDLLIQNYPEATQEKASMWGLLPLHLAVDFSLGKGGGGGGAPSSKGAPATSNTSKGMVGGGSGSQKRKKARTNAGAVPKDCSIQLRYRSSPAEAAADSSETTMSSSIDASHTVTTASSTCSISSPMNHSNVSSVGFQSASNSPNSNYAYDDSSEENEYPSEDRFGTKKHHDNKTDDDDDDHCQIVHLLLKHYPEALYVQEEFHGMLPLHIAASSAPTMDGKIPAASAHIISSLLTHAPETIESKDYEGDTPWVLADRANHHHQQQRQCHLDQSFHDNSSSHCNSSIRTPIRSNQTPTHVVLPLPDWKRNPILYPQSSVPEEEEDDEEEEEEEDEEEEEEEETDPSEDHDDNEDIIFSSLFVGTMDQLMALSSSASASTTSVRHHRSIASGSCSSYTGSEADCNSVSSTNDHDHSSSSANDTTDDDDMDEELRHLAELEHDLRKELEASIRLHCPLEFSDDEEESLSNRRHNDGGSMSRSPLCLPALPDDAVAEAQQEPSFGESDSDLNLSDTSFALDENDSVEDGEGNVELSFETLEVMLDSTDRLMEKFIETVHRTDSPVSSDADDDLNEELAHLSSFEESLSNEIEADESYQTFLQYSFDPSMEPADHGGFSGDEKDSSEQSHPGDDSAKDMHPVSPSCSGKEVAKDSSSLEPSIPSTATKTLLVGTLEILAENQHEEVDMADADNDVARPTTTVSFHCSDRLDQTHLEQTNAKLDMTMGPLLLSKSGDVENITIKPDYWDEIPLSPLQETRREEATPSCKTEKASPPVLADCDKDAAAKDPQPRLPFPVKRKTRLILPSTSFPSYIWGLPSIDEQPSFDGSVVVTACSRQASAHPSPQREARDEDRQEDAPALQGNISKEEANGSSVDEEREVIIHWERTAVLRARTAELPRSDKSNETDQSPASKSGVVRLHNQDTIPSISWIRVNSRAVKHSACESTDAYVRPLDPAKANESHAPTITWVRIRTASSTKATQEQHYTEENSGAEAGEPPSVDGGKPHKVLLHSYGENSADGEAIAHAYGVATVATEEALNAGASPATECSKPTSVVTKESSDASNGCVENPESSRRTFWKIAGGDLVADFFDQTGDLANLFPKPRVGDSELTERACERAEGAGHMSSEYRYDSDGEEVEHRVNAGKLHETSETKKMESLENTHDESSKLQDEPTESLYIQSDTRHDCAEALESVEQLTPNRQEEEEPARDGCVQMQEKKYSSDVKTFVPPNEQPSETPTAKGSLPPKPKNGKKRPPGKQRTPAGKNANDNKNINSQAITASPQGPLTEIHGQMQHLKNENERQAKEMAKLKQRISIMTEVKGVSLQDLRQVLQEVCGKAVDSDCGSQSKALSCTGHDSESVVAIPEVLDHWYQELEEHDREQNIPEVVATSKESTACSLSSLSPPRIIKTNDGIDNWSIKEDLHGEMVSSDTGTAPGLKRLASFAEDAFATSNIEEQFGEWFEELIGEEAAISAKRNSAPAAAGSYGQDRDDYSEENADVFPISLGCHGFISKDNGIIEQKNTDNSNDPNELRNVLFDEHEGFIGVIDEGETAGSENDHSIEKRNELSICFDELSAEEREINNRKDSVSSEDVLRSTELRESNDQESEPSGNLAAEKAIHSGESKGRPKDDPIIGVEITTFAKTSPVTQADPVQVEVDRKQRLREMVNKRYSMTKVRAVDTSKLAGNLRLREMVKKSSRMTTARAANASELVGHLLQSRTMPPREQRRPCYLDQTFDEVWGQSFPPAVPTAPISKSLMLPPPPPPPPPALPRQPLPKELFVVAADGQDRTSSVPRDESPTLGEGLETFDNLSAAMEDIVDDLLRDERKCPGGTTFSALSGATTGRSERRRRTKLSISVQAQQRDAAEGFKSKRAREPPSSTPGCCDELVGDFFCGKELNAIISFSTAETRSAMSCASDCLERKTNSERQCPISRSKSMDKDGRAFLNEDDSVDKQDEDEVSVYFAKLAEELVQDVEKAIAGFSSLFSSVHDPNQADPKPLARTRGRYGHTKILRTSSSASSLTRSAWL